MHLRIRPTALALLATLSSTLVAMAPVARSAQADELRKFEGEWLYVKDITEGRSVEEQGPPMSVKFALRVEKDAVLPAVLDVVERAPPTQHVVRDVQHVIGLVVRMMDFQEGDGIVDALRQPELLHHPVDRTDPAVRGRHRLL